MVTRKHTERGYWAQYFVNNFIAFDQWIFNVLPSPLFNLIDFRGLAGPYGDPDETLCGVAGKIRDGYGGKQGRVPWNHPVAACVDRLMELIDRNHTFEAVEEDEGDDALGR